MFQRLKKILGRYNNDGYVTSQGLDSSSIQIKRKKLPRSDPAVEQDAHRLTKKKERAANKKSVYMSNQTVLVVVMCCRC